MVNRPSKPVRNVLACDRKPLDRKPVRLGLVRSGCSVSTITIEIFDHEPPNVLVETDDAHFAFNSLSDALVFFNNNYIL